MAAEKGFKELLLEKLPDLVGLIVFIVGAVFFVLAAIHKFSYGKLNAPIDDPQWRNWTAVAGITDGDRYRHPSVVVEEVIGVPVAIAGR